MMSGPVHTYALDMTWRALLKDLGVRPANVLRRAGLPEDLLQQPSVRLAPDAYYRFWDGLEAETGDALLPLRLCQAFRSESFSPPLFAALCSPNLLVAVQRIAHYKKLVAPMRLGLSVSRGRFSLELAWLDAPHVPPASFVLAELLFFVSLARMGTREHLRPLEVTTPAPPSPAGPYEAFFGTRVRRGTKHRLVFTAADAQLPFLTSNDALWRTFEPGLRQRLAELDAEASTERRVRAALLEGLPSGRGSMDDVARTLGLSRRTLQRRMEAEGTRFQQVLQRTRASLARHYLQTTQLPAAEISFLLGFDEPNSFYRAYREWTGTTPGNARHARKDAP